MTFRRIAAAAALLFLSLAAAAPAQDRSPAERLAAWDSDAARAEEVLATGEASTSALEVLRETLVQQRAGARAMVAEETKKLEPLRKQLEALGPKPEGDATEPEGVAATRADLLERLKPGEGRLKEAEFALTRVEGLIRQLDSVIRSRFTNTLLSIGPSPVQPWRWPGAVAEYVNLGDRLVAEAIQGQSEAVAKRNRETRLPAVAIVTLLALLAIYWARRTLNTAIRRNVRAEAGRGRRLAIGLTAAVLRLFAPMVVLGLCMLALSQSGWIGVTAAHLEKPFIGGLIAIIVGVGLGQVVFAPDAPDLRIAPLSDAHARRGARLSAWLGVVIFLEAVLIAGGAETGLAPSALAVANLPIVVLGGVALYRFARLIRPKAEKIVREEEAEEEPQEQAHLLVRALRAFSIFMMIAAILSPVAASLGYFAASRYILHPVIMTLGLVAVASLLFIAFREAVNAYVEEREVEAPGLRLLSILLGFLLACASIPFLALIWGARVADLAEWWGLVADGFRIGEVSVSPLDFVKFALIFTIGYSLTRMVQGVLRISVLPNTRLDSGARGAIVSGTGYVGFFLAGLAAIAATGLDLSNVAIVAGALSVGIGFGLQTIVSNFVSGIILLIERPIKAGDWIEVGSNQGYVTKVSVRATEIETFDRATLIVPNSELIANSVLNMTHSSMIGRVRVPVGVAYGTDTRKVEKILMEIVKDHPMVLRKPPPNVIFMGFGADSLDFEIRGFLRDVNFALSTKSDMNHEINRRFAEEGIEIPFAQRDLHIRNLDAVSRSIRDAFADAPEEEEEDAEPSDDAAPESVKPRRRRTRNALAADKPSDDD